MKSLLLLVFSITLLMNYGNLSKLDVNVVLKKVLLRGLVFVASVCLLTLSLGFFKPSLDNFLQEQSLYTVIHVVLMTACVIFSLMMMVASILVPFRGFDSWMRQMLHLSESGDGRINE